MLFPHLGVGSVLAQADTADDLRSACGREPGRLCEWVFDQTGSKAFALVADWVLNRPLSILVIVVGAFVVTRLIRRGVAHLRDRLTDEVRSKALERARQGRAGRLLLDQEVDARASARTETITGVLTSTATITVWIIAGLLIMGEIGISLAPLLAGAGIAGFAIGFGAQSIVRDFLSGFFMLAEDQYGVGDVVDLGDVAGTVERVSLRTTVLRDVDGVVWHIPNGEVARVGNKSQLWSRAVLDIEVAYDTDLRFAQGVLQRVADEVWRDPDFKDGDIIAPPEVWGVESLGADGIALRLVVKTDPAEQWVVARELRLRIKEAFDEAGIEIPFPQRTVWLNHEDRSQPKPDPSTVALSTVRRGQGAEIVEPEPEH
jgi:moderate conductance mechanosensitive channel